MVKKLMVMALAFSLGALSTFGQSSYSGTQDFSGATVRLPNGASDPATCTVADIFANTTSGATVKVCTALNTWGLLGIGGSTGSTDNAILRADGTGGSTLQASNCTIDDDGLLTCSEDSATTNAGVPLLALSATTTGTAAAGFGPQFVAYTENAAGGAEQGGRILNALVVATDSYAGYTAWDFYANLLNGNEYRVLRVGPLGSSFPTMYPGTGPSVGYVSDAGIGLVGMGLQSSNANGFIGLSSQDAVGTVYFAPGHNTDASGQQALGSPGLTLVMDGRNGTTADYVTLTTRPRSAATNALAPDLNLGAGPAESFSDAAGSDTVLYGGQARGAGTPGDAVTQTAVVAGTGTTAQTLGDRARILGAYKTLSEASATDFARCSLATSGSVAGGVVEVTVEANDATDYQARTLAAEWSAVNKAGTVTVGLGTVREAAAVSAGTLTCTLAAAADSTNIDFSLDCTSSLTQTTLRANAQVRKNFGAGACSAL